MRKILLLVLLNLINIFSAHAYEINNELWQRINSPKNLIVSFYLIHGKDSTEIIQQMRESGPVSVSGNRHYAATNWKLSWRWENKTTGTDYRKTRVDASILITLPFLVNSSLSKAPYWQDFYNILVAHELRHYSHALTAKYEIEDLVTEFPEDLQTTEANKQILEIIQLARNKDIEYDHFTNHGKKESDSILFK